MTPTAPVPHLDISGTMTSMQELAATASTTGAQAAGDFRAGFIGQLNQTMLEATRIMEQIRGALQFDAWPNIAPQGAPASPTTPGRQSSAFPGYDMRDTANSDISHWSA